jgi:hypothetical protein
MTLCMRRAVRVGGRQCLKVMSAVTGCILHNKNAAALPVNGISGCGQAHLPICTLRDDGYSAPPPWLTLAYCGHRGCCTAANNQELCLHGLSSLHPPQPAQRMSISQMSLCCNCVCCHVSQSIATCEGSGGVLCHAGSTMGIYLKAQLDAIDLFLDTQKEHLRLQHAAGQRSRNKVCQRSSLHPNACLYPSRWRCVGQWGSTNGHAVCNGKCPEADYECMA